MSESERGDRGRGRRERGEGANGGLEFLDKLEWSVGVEGDSGGVWESAGVTTWAPPAAKPV